MIRQSLLQNASVVLPLAAAFDLGNGDLAAPRAPPSASRHFWTGGTLSGQPSRSSI